jgi:hypothetical protein
MQKTITQLTSTIAGKIGLLHLDHDTPIQVVKEMLVEFLTYVGNVEAQIKAQQAAQAAQENPPVADVAHAQVAEAELVPAEQPVEPQVS